MSATASSGWLLPVVFAIATALPVVIVAWIFSFSAGSIGRFYNRMAVFQKWMNLIVGIIFVAIGIYYSIMTFI